MKIIKFVLPTETEGCTYAPDQVVAFGNDALADSLINDDRAEPSNATIFVEHVNRAK